MATYAARTNNVMTPIKISAGLDFININVIAVDIYIDKIYILTGQNTSMQGPHFTRGTKFKDIDHEVCIKRKGPGWWGVQNPYHWKYLQELWLFNWRRKNIWREPKFCSWQVEAFSCRSNELPAKLKPWGGGNCRKWVFSFVEGKRKLAQIQCPLRPVWLKQRRTVKHVPQLTGETTAELCPVAALHVQGCQIWFFKEAKHLDFCVKTLKCWQLISNSLEHYAGGTHLGAIHNLSFAHLQSLH